MLCEIHICDDIIYISYLKKRLIWDYNNNTFVPLSLPTQNKLEFYKKATGLSESDLIQKKKIYPDNNYDIPVPTFMELYKEHAVSPFFVFQIFCCFLWMMDEYWQYSLMTFFLLVFLEAQVVTRRVFRNFCLA